MKYYSTHRIQGIDVVVKEIETVLRGMNERAVLGLPEFVATLHEDMEKTSPTIPLDLGNLRASWFTSMQFKGDDATVFFGFKSNYALYVHEMEGSDIKWKRPGSGPKFMEKALKRNKNKYLDILRKYI